MLLPSYLRRSRHGVFYIRIVLPQRLAAALGQREFVRSLGIKSPMIAKKSGYQIARCVQPLLQRLQDVMAIDPNSIDPKEVKKLIAEGLVFRPGGELSIGRLETSSDPAIAKQEMDAIAATAKSWQELHRDNFVQGLSEEAIAQRQAEALRLRDELSKVVGGLAQTDPGTQQPLRPATLREAFDLYLTSKQRIAQSSKESYTESFELFAALMGGEKRMIHDIRAFEVKEFNDALAHVPMHAAKRGIPLASAGEILKSPPILQDKQGRPIDPISAKTANSHVSNLRSFFRHAIQAGHRDGANPFDGLPRHSDGQQQVGAEAFDEQELRTIFNPATFMEAKRPTQFWGLLLALYTGARLNEVACLDLADFVEDSGIRCIAIRRIPKAKPHTVAHKANPHSRKQIKNAESRRLVPLHPDLFAIGIEDYIADLRELNATRFFPTLPEDTKGKRERRLSFDGNEYLKRVKVHVDRIKVMHSFRDTVCEKLSEKKMDSVRADQWTGHAPQGIKAQHYRRSKADIALQAQEGFAALHFPFIDCEKLRYKKGWWNDYIQKNMVD